ncbi:MAG: hypothetical protein GXP29_00785 [Planctomycetes bacterium]|nr:hypothetical protein [Planctomycetota bacterium]
MMAKKKNYFTPAIDKHFEGWILMPTWWKSNLTEEKQFHRFVLAVHKLSKLAGGKACMGKWVRNDQGHFKTDDRGYLRENGHRNPRTLDREKFKANIIEAVRRNQKFDEEYLETLATKYTDKAMYLLDFLWQTRDGLPNLSISDRGPDREGQPPISARRETGGGEKTRMCE